LTPKRVVLLLVCASAVLSGKTGLAGTVTGGVTVTGAAEADRTVVYIESLPQGSYEATAASSRLSQRGATFNPPLLAVVQGTQVDMTNDDWVAHSVFSKSEVKPFDLGLYAQDTRKVVTFDKLGAVQVFCAIHPRMNTVILVLQNPFFAKPGRDGRFSLAGVPAGTYQVKVFRVGGTALSAKVTVPPTGSVEVRF